HGDAGGVADEVRAVRALVRAARGELADGCQILIELVQARRARGDELAALRGEIDLAALYERRGELRAAAETASVAAEAARRLELDALARRGDDIAAAVEVAAWRRPAAGERVRGAGRGPISDAAARGENRAALAIAREAAAAAERIGNPADLADALAWCSRLEMAAGDRAAAELAAARAAREAAACGATWARCAALLVLAAASRENGDLVAASSYARDAAEVAAAAGLAVERLVAERALEAIAGPGGRQALGGAAAGMSEAAREMAGRALADLGLISVRPFRLVGPDGQESRVADASPERLRIAERDLVVDGVRECIVRSGKPVADLRRRSLLKRLLFLFAARPGRIFSKEEIVQTVWSVEYHPLRHDAALFTNIMRIRRLLGRDGAELIRVSEEGYRFTPGKDFLFVEPA
ncbi:MAG TPA: helix-turn-helix domain-containing protein, partial [Kofleriaceae bacterium]|nr:helix-turn-helix domain-containing protein [Kofleriaceae bacterium]